MQKGGGKAGLTVQTDDQRTAVNVKYGTSIFNRRKSGASLKSDAPLRVSKKPSRVQHIIFRRGTFFIITVIPKQISSTAAA